MSTLPASVPPARLASPARLGPGRDNAEWLLLLRCADEAGVQAHAELHGLLVRAAAVEIRRRGGSTLSSQECSDLAVQVADDALAEVLAHLDSFRGESRFTTWAYKFALYGAALALRRRVWAGREIPFGDTGWSMLTDPAAGPAELAEYRELAAALQEGITSALTSHQRDVLVALVFSGVPIDVLADRLRTSRGALYKTLHDARRKLRAHLAAEGFGPQIEGLGGRSDV